MKPSSNNVKILTPESHGKNTSQWHSHFRWRINNFFIIFFFSIMRHNFNVNFYEYISHLKVRDDLQFINETVRLANIVPGIFRKALREINFKGMPYVIACLYAQISFILRKVQFLIYGFKFDTQPIIGLVRKFNLLNLNTRMYKSMSALTHSLYFK